MWVSGLSSNTKAAALKNLFGKYGKVNDTRGSLRCCMSPHGGKKKDDVFSCQVLSAKVVTNARSPGSKCYGLVTMSSSADVTRCISHLDCTELHGQKIFVVSCVLEGKKSPGLFMKRETFVPEISIFQHDVCVVLSVHK